MEGVCRSYGTVKWFSEQKGFGFIVPDDGTDDLFVHQSSIRSDGFRTLSEGESVEFDVETGDDGRIKAVNVTGPNGSSVQGERRGGFGDGSRGGSGRGGGYGFNGGGSRVGSGGRSSGGGGYGSGGSYGVGGGGNCYNCGEAGHLARDCYQGGGGGGRQGGSRGSGGGGSCYGCGEQGHFARDCPNNVGY